MFTTLARNTMFALLLGPLAVAGCDGPGDSGTETGGETESATEGTTNANSDSGEGGQGRDVYVCGGVIVCEDSSQIEVYDTLCMTPTERSALLAEVDCEMPIACEDIGDGYTLECSFSCEDQGESCECDDPELPCSA